MATEDAGIRHFDPGRTSVIVGSAISSFAVAEGGGMAVLKKAHIKFSYIDRAHMRCSFGIF